MKFFHWRSVIHLHHAFTGIVLAIVFYFMNFEILFNLSIAFALSDFFQHFVVLKYLEGDDEFDMIEKLPKKRKKKP